MKDFDGGCEDGLLGEALEWGECRMDVFYTMLGGDEYIYSRYSCLSILSSSSSSSFLLSNRLQLPRSSALSVCNLLRFPSSSRQYACIPSCPSHPTARP